MGSEEQKEAYFQDFKYCFKEKLLSKVELVEILFFNNSLFD